MPSWLNKYLSLIAGLLLDTLLFSATARAESHVLLSRSGTYPMVVALDQQQRSWLQGKRELRVGSSAPDYPPFDLTASARDYEGLTADYLGILASALDLPIKVQRFHSRLAAIKALEEGSIDLLGTSNGFEADNPQLLLSTPYAIDQPVLVTREGDSRSLPRDLAGLRLSLVHHYLPLDEVKALYPKAIIHSYPSTQNAINSVAFGQTDVFLGDTVSAHYMISKGHLKNIKMANFGKPQPHGFSFAVHRDNRQLLEMINTTLQAVPGSERDSIARRWNAGSNSLLASQKLQLTEREEQWLSQHPVVKVVVNETLAPLTFFDPLQIEYGYH